MKNRIRNRLKKRAGIIPFLPLLALLLIIAYGLLESDYSDTEGKFAYGWNYIFFFALPFWVFLQASLIGNVVYFAVNRERWKSFFFKFYGLATISSLAYFMTNPLKVLLFMAEVQESVTLWIFLAAVIIMPIVQILSYLSKEPSWLKVSMVLVLIGLVFSPLVFKPILSRRTQEQVRANVTSFYKEAAPNLQVKVTKIDDFGANITLKDKNLKLPARVFLTKSRQIKGSTYLSPAKGLPNILGYVITSKESQDLLEAYKKSIQATLKKEGFSAELKGNSYIDFGYTSKGIPDAVKSLAQKKAQDPKTSAFGGYPYVAIKDYVTSQLVVPRLKVDDVKDFEPSPDFLRSGDFSNLPNGIYMLNDKLFYIEDGKFKGILNEALSTLYSDWEFLNPTSEDFSSEDKLASFTLKEPAPKIHQARLLLTSSSQAASSSKAGTKELSEEEKTEAARIIKTYYQRKDQSYEVSVAYGLDEADTYYAYLHQGSQKVPIGAVLAWGKVVEISFNGEPDSFDANLMLRSLATNPQVQLYRQRFQQAIEAALKKTGLDARFSLTDEKNYLTQSQGGFKFNSLNDAVRSMMAKNEASKDPNRSAFFGTGGLTDRTLIKEEVLVPYVQLDFNDSLSSDYFDNKEKLLDKLIDHMDGSQLADGLYDLDGEIIRVKNGKISRDENAYGLTDLPNPDYFVKLTEYEWQTEIKDLPN